MGALFATPSVGDLFDCAIALCTCLLCLAVKEH